MWQTIYTGLGALLLFGYLGWAWMGLELGSSTRDPVPTARSYSTRSGGGGGYYYGRSRGGYSGGGFGWGK